MLLSARGATTQPTGVRLLLLLVSCVSIATGLLAAPCTSAAQTGSDSTASGESRTPIPATLTPAPPTPAARTPAPPTAAARTAAALKANNYRLHLHGGLFAPIDVNAPAPTLGLRLGRRVTSHLQAGLLLGWTFERKNLEQPINALPSLQPHLILARVDGHLLPAMLFLNVDLNETRWLVPYGGIAAGYEWFVYRASDFRTGETASATYANLAWETWGGMGMRLGTDLRVDFEVFYNGGSLERAVTDSTGRSQREAINANGAGARVGLNILF